jgi:hypothetical protein
MRYSVDVAGVARVATEFSASMEGVQSSARAALTAVDSAVESFSPAGSHVAHTLLGIFAQRRSAEAGFSACAADIITAVQTATVAYITADDQMATEASTRSDLSASAVIRRGFGAGVQ